MKVKTDQVYVVTWPGEGMFKIGHSSVRRWEGFATRPEVVSVFDFTETVEAYQIEGWLHEVARTMLPAADATRSRILLGNKGAGYAECFQGDAADARAVIAEAMRRAMPDAEMLKGAQA